MNTKEVIMSEPSSSSLGNKEDENKEEEDVVDQEEVLMKEYRRNELLTIARKSRLRWILEAREKKIDYSTIMNKKKSSNGNKNDKNEDVDVTKHNLKLDFYNKVPAASCLQEIINFLVDMTVIDDDKDDENGNVVMNEKEYIDIETLAPSDTLDDELVEVSLEDISTYDNMNNEMSSYSIFLEKLKHSSASDIVQNLRKFVTKIETYIRDGSYNSHIVTIQPTVTSTIMSKSTTISDIKLDIAQEIFDIMEQTEQLLRKNILWSSETTSQFNETMISLEKFIFRKLYYCLLPQIVKKNSDRDEMLRERIVSLSFLDPEHLDIVPLKKLPKSREKQFLSLKQKLKIKDNELVNASNIEMNTMNLNMKNVHTEGLAEAVYLLKYTLTKECFSPTEKMDCLREISQSVIETISANKVNKVKKAHNTSQDSDNVIKKPVVSPDITKKKKQDLPGADDLLPALILAIKEANPPHLLSTISFLETYLSPKKLFSESGYILTHFISAVQFLEKVNADALTISPLEFEESMYQCK